MQITLDKWNSDWARNDEYFMCSDGFTKIFGQRFADAPSTIALTYSDEPISVNSIIIEVERFNGTFIFKSRFGSLSSSDFYWNFSALLKELVEDGEVKYFFVDIN